MNCIKIYQTEMTEILSKNLPELSKDEISERIKKVMKKKFRDNQVKLNNKNNSLLQICNFIDKNNLIKTGYGCLYNTDYENNLKNKLIDFLLVSRSKVKKEMLSYVNATENNLVALYEFLEKEQKNLKLLNNSFYGASIEPNSIFYHPFVGPSITYTGRIIITTAVVAFESFFGNFGFEDVSSSLKYVNTIIEEDYDNSFLNINATVEDVYNFLESKIENHKGINSLETYLRSLTQEELNKIYYKNNIYKFLDNDFVHNKMDNIIKHLKENDLTFLNCNKPSDDLKLLLDDFWNIIKENVAYIHLWNNRDKRANGTRKVVLTIDTDSNFIHLKPFYNYISENFNNINNEDEIETLNILNVITSVLSKYIDTVYFELGTSLGIAKEHRHRINMKNEFLYKRIMLTKNKKQYAGTLIAREGNYLNPPKTDMKGLSIRKINVNKNIRNRFTEILEENILKNPKVNPAEVLGHFKEIMTDIAKSLNEGKVEYLIPGKVNEIENYAAPFTIQTVRGSLLWNSLYPDENIVFPTKDINILKLKDLTLSEVENTIGEKYPDKFEIIKNSVFNNENLSKYGIKVICIPRNKKEIPKWLIPLINTEEMIQNNVKNGFILLESLGFDILEFTHNKKSFSLPTNIIRF